MESIDLRLDVTEAVGQNAFIAVTVTLPSIGAMADRPIVCFAKPGAGYNRRYYTIDLPGPGAGAQADWHAERGWIFVSVDHLGVGESSTHHSPEQYTYANLVAAAHAAEQQVLQRLATGSLTGRFPKVTNPVTIGVGHSMGGCMTVVQQGRYNTYDGIAILGFSAVFTQLPTPPGTPPIVMPWIPRDIQPDFTGKSDPAHDPGILNKAALADPGHITYSHPDRGRAMAWGFHYDDVDPQIDDVTNIPARHGSPPPWASTTLPGTSAVWGLVPGAIAPEAASVTVPVLLGMGERDFISDPKGEPRAYLSATSIDLFRCPRMGHMHNFAGTREIMWQRIENWAQWVRTNLQLPNSSPNGS